MPLSIDYWPYGEKMAEYVSGGTTGQRNVFTEKERDIESGYDYFGARFYDSDLGRWMTVDPLADKYPGWSPYNYVMGNTLNSFDPDGRDVIVLLAPKGASWAGHTALLIGNETKGWTYISKDGTQKNSGSKLFGEPRYANLELKVGVDIKEFLAKNTEHEYERGYWIPTDKDQDESMKEAAEKAAKEYYDVLTNNCKDVVTRALEAAGLYGGLQIVYKMRPQMQYVTIEPEIGYSKIPRIRYSAILRGNHGFEFTFSLKDIYNIKKAGTGQE